ncbi:hypothetical protein [Ottowia thiooxydans]|uniref:hypothetical protein n=1 Tax=Ottowia thiooxydans TaxID=219182 RepID=UPI001FE0C5C7|nr:hypothetical protein [Ottowia thiooxydans]
MKFLPVRKPREPDALELAHGHSELEQAVLKSRRLLHKRAVVAGVAGAIPVPGLDWAVDAAMLARLLPKINEEFGLTPQQIDKLDSKEKERVQKAVAMAGSVIIGRVVTRDLIFRFARTIGLRLTTAQASKYVPFAGQLISGALGYAALRYLGEQHIRDCVKVVRAAVLALPAPERRVAMSYSKTQAADHSPDRVPG